MEDWNQIRWTEARQIAELIDNNDDGWPAPGITPQAHFAALRQAGERTDAAAFLGHALPRLEAVAWAGAVLDAEAATLTLKPRDRHALDVALRWLGDPTEEHRRAAQDTIDTASDRAPERLLAMAVFYSGGSISLPDLPSVLPPPEAAGRAAAAAIVMAAYRSDDPAAALDRALDLGEKVAAQGTRVL